MSIGFWFCLFIIKLYSQKDIFKSITQSNIFTQELETIEKTNIFDIELVTIKIQKRLSNYQGP